jgi:6-methylsalicylic acid synthase
MRIAFRSGQRYVPHFSPLAAAESRFECDAAGVYLIVGGTGELGLHTARWLVRRGARNIVLAGRRPFPDRAEWSGLRQHPLQGPKIEIMEDLLRAGVTPQFLRCDVGQRADVEALLERIRHLGPIRGLVQAAAVVSDRLLSLVTAEEFRRALEPKIAGTWNLLQALRDEPLHLCVFYSSLGSVVGIPGQGSYAAGNAFIDSLARSANREDRTMLSINWCVWRNTGLARTTGGRRALAELESRGISSVSSDEATTLLGQAIASGRNQAIAFPIAHASAADARSADPLLANLLARYRRAADPAAIASPSAGSPGMFSGLGGPELAEKLEQLVVTTIAELLDIAPTAVNLDHSLGDMGMDSLLSLEFHKAIQRRFELVLPATLAWNFPTARTLVARIVSMVTKADSPDETREPATRIPDPDSRTSSQRIELDEMSDDDALRQLMGRS